MFIFIFIYCLITTKVIQYESIYNGDETSITGKIISYSINGNKLKINIKDQEEIIATYYIETQEELAYLKENIGIGKTITVNGSLNRPLNNTIPNNSINEASNNMSSTINEIPNINNQTIEQPTINQEASTKENTYTNINQNIQNNVGEGTISPIPEININNTETL